MNFRAAIRYFGMPLKASSLWVIVTFGIGITGVQFLGLFGVPLFCVLFPWFLKYGFVVLDDVVEGRKEPAPLSAELMNPFEQRPLILFLVLGTVHGATGALAPWVGDTIVTAIRVGVLCLVPAMVGTVAINGRIIDFINPRAIIGTIARIPREYAGLLCVLIALWTIPVWLVQQAADELSRLWIPQSFLPGFVFLAIGPSGAAVAFGGVLLFMYLWLAMFACIGGVLYERRMELSYEPAESPERKAARAAREQERARDRIMDAIFAEVRGGALSNAGKSVRELIERDPRPLTTCRWVYAHAASARDQRLADYIAHLTLPRLLDAKATGEALEMLQDRLARTPSFRPATSGLTLQLAQLACDAGDRALARRLVEDFVVRFPADPLIGRAVDMMTALAR